jgi:hypothetical protein
MYIIDQDLPRPVGLLNTLIALNQYYDHIGNYIAPALSSFESQYIALWPNPSAWELFPDLGTGFYFDQLTALLNAHLFPNIVELGQDLDGTMITSLAGQNITFSVDDQGSTIGTYGEESKQFRVTDIDIPLGDGMLHLIDQ